MSKLFFGHRLDEKLVSWNWLVSHSLVFPIISR